MYNCDIMIILIVNTKIKRMDKELPIKIEKKRFWGIVVAIGIQILMMTGVFVVWSAFQKGNNHAYVLIDMLATTITSTGIIIWFDIKNEWGNGRCKKVYIIVLAIIILLEAAIIIATKTINELYTVGCIKYNMCCLAIVEGTVMAILMPLLITSPICGEKEREEKQNSVSGVKL